MRVPCMRILVVLDNVVMVGGYVCVGLRNDVRDPEMRVTLVAAAVEDGCR